MTLAGLVRTDYRTLSGWAGHDHEAAFAAFRHSAKFLLKHPPKSKHQIFDVNLLLATAKRALDWPDSVSRATARAFFESNFAPFSIEEDGLMTGYYEPEFEARLAPDRDFQHPLHHRPKDLVAISTEEALAAGFSEETSFACKKEGRLQYHLSRGEILAGGLDGQNLELVWLRDPFEAYIIHIQGSARLRLKDGQSMRVTFDGKSGHPYQSLGKLLISEGRFTPETITMDRLIQHLRDQGQDGVAYLARNPSYIFFEAVEGSDLSNMNTGPLAAARVPLVPFRSIAMDRHLHTFGMPFWLQSHLPTGTDTGTDTDTDTGTETKPFRQLVFAHDTGSAIKGLARADLFCGTGREAGLLAGRLQHSARFTCLLPTVPSETKEVANGEKATT